MSISCFSSVSSSISLTPMISTFTGNIFLPLGTTSFPTGVDISANTIYFNNKGLLNGNYTIRCNKNYNSTYMMSYPFNNTSLLNSTTYGWLSKNLDSIINTDLDTFNVINLDGTVSSIKCVWLQIDFPFYYSNLYSYNILSAVQWAYAKTRTPRIFYILGSDNNTNWYVLDYISNPLSYNLPSETYGGVDMSSNKGVIRKNANFNSIRLAILDSYEPTGSGERPVLVSQFYASGTAVTTYNSLQLFYRFNSTETNDNTNLGNYATRSIVYDASLSNSNAITSNNTLALSTTGNVKINKSISTDASGISFSFSMKMANSTSYIGNSSVGVNTIFDFGNGPGTDNIIFGTIGNKIYTNITSGNTSTSGTFTFANYTLPWSSYTIQSDSTNYYIISNGFAVSSDETTAVYYNYSSRTVYVSRKINNSWSEFISIASFYYIDGELYGIAITADGNRIVGGLKNSTLQNNALWFSNKNINNGAFDTINTVTYTTAQIDCIAIAMTADGNRVVLINGYDGKLYHTTWTGTTYEIPVLSNSVANDLYSCAISKDGYRVACSSLNTANKIYIGTWNSTGYIFNQSFITTTIGDVYNLAFSNNNNILFLTKNNNSTNGLFYTKWNGSAYNETLTAVSSSAIPENNIYNGIVLTDDEKSIYALDISNQAIYRSALTISNSETNTNIYTTEINDNTWRDYLWTISSTGKYTYYVNGLKVYESTGGLVVPTTARTLNFIGKSNSLPYSYFVGELDNFRMYNRAVDISELKSITNKVPDAPLYFNVSNTNPVILSFVTPIQDVNYYTINAIHTSGNTVLQTISPTITSYTVTGLPNLNYLLSLNATNNYGTSNSTNSFYRIVPPSDIAVSSFSYTKISISFTEYDLSNNYNLTLLDVSGGNSVSQTITTGTSTYTFSSLNINSLYLISIYSVYLNSYNSSTISIYGNTKKDVWTIRTSGLVTNGDWRYLCSSSDGTKLAGCAYGNSIYTSIDSGVTWTRRNSNGIPSTSTWISVDCSSDGTKLVASAFNSSTYTSTDSGVTWTNRTVGQINVKCFCSNSNGNILLGGFTHSYISTDSGVTWVQRPATGRQSVNSCGISYSGTNMIIGVGQNPYSVYISTNTGTNWLLINDLSSSTISYSAVACNSSGNIFIAAASNNVYISTDTGTNWLLRNSGLPVSGVTDCKINSDNSLITLTNGQGVYNSYNTGLSWIKDTNAPNANCRSIAISSNGEKKVTCVASNTIYTSVAQSSFIPDSPTNLIVSSVVSNSATVTFNAPPQTVTFYDISAVPLTGNTISARITAPASSYTFSGLSSGTNTVLLTALNTYGRSFSISTSLTI